jgi:hypothetical protein
MNAHTNYVPYHFRNNGVSFGLEYPYIFGKTARGWSVWNRYTGKIVFVADLNPMLDECVFKYEVEKKCLELNGLRDKEQR